MTVTQDAAVALDTPAQIGGWYYMSGVSQLTSEIRSGDNWYGKTSVYKGILRNIVGDAMHFPAKATRQNKVMLLTALCYLQPSSPVIDSARALLEQVRVEEGLAFEIA